MSEDLMTVFFQRFIKDRTFYAKYLTQTAKDVMKSHILSYDRHGRSAFDMRSCVYNGEAIEHILAENYPDMVKFNKDIYEDMDILGWRVEVKTFLPGRRSDAVDRLRCESYKNYDYALLFERKTTIPVFRMMDEYKNLPNFVHDLEDLVYVGKNLLRKRGQVLEFVEV